jgi:glycosyltransferase involved in cell wall biosynthesis
VDPSPRVRYDPSVKARVLYVTEKFPWPVDDGGQIRAYQILKGMTAEFEVTLIGLRPPRPEHEEPIRKLGVEVVTFPRGTRSKAAVGWYAAQALFTHRPYPLNKNFSSAMLAEIRRRIQDGVELVHLNQIDSAQYIDYLGDLRGSFRSLFETQNVLTTMYERFYETAEGALRRTYTKQQWHKMARYEPEVMRRFDRVAVCSEVERELCGTWGVDNVAVVENGVDTELFAPIPNKAPLPVHASPADAKPTLVFTGAMNYLPNREGFEWFLDEVVPLLERRLPAFRLLVVGKHPPEHLLARAKPGSLEFTGYVDDVRDPMREGDVSIVPLRIGSGTRIKILEAMALGLPVVSTSVGAEGLAVTHGEDILLADDPEGLATAIAELCGSPERRDALAAAGRALVLRRYDWKAVTAPLIDFYLDRATAPA